MSRIHDAMKKAEREGRSSADEVDPLLPPGTSAPPTPNMSAPFNDFTLPTQGLFPRGGASDVVTFEEIMKRCAHPQWRPDPDLNVFANPLLSTLGAEQFRTLRSRLYQLRNAQPLRVLLLTSSVAFEGKTFTVNNLAHAIVRQPERRVLVIDADLRCPRLHLMLGAPLSPGLSDYLSGGADEFAVIQHGSEGNLCFIPSGATVHNPSELLSNGRLKILLNKIASAFDWVIFDSPPCLPIADASVLVDFCDAALLVTRAGSTPAAVVQRAVQELQTRKNVIGVVLNGAEESTAGYTTYEKGPKLVEPPGENTSLGLTTIASRVAQ